MEEPKKEPEKKAMPNRAIRFFAWPITYLFAPSWGIIRGAGKVILPTKIPAEQIKIFTGLTPAERWDVAREIQGWTDGQLVAERKISCWLGYLFLAVSIAILLFTGWAMSYVSLSELRIIQIAPYVAYSSGFFLLFAKRSMRVYAIDRQQIILLWEWLKIPSVWLPALSPQLPIQFISR